MLYVRRIRQHTSAYVIIRQHTCRDAHMLYEARWLEYEALCFEYEGALVEISRSFGSCRDGHMLYSSWIIACSRNSSHFVVQCKVVQMQEREQP